MCVPSVAQRESCVAGRSDRSDRQSVLRGEIDGSSPTYVRVVRSEDSIAAVVTSIRGNYRNLGEKSYYSVFELVIN